MKLLVLYGPPAAGKLTVAGHIAARSDYKLFDNHASIDLANRLFSREDAGFNKIVRGVRELVFEVAARAGQDLVFTLVYAHPEDIPTMQTMTKLVEDNGGQVQFVHLSCSADTLRTRVENESRKAFTKISSREVLADILDSYDVFSPYPQGQGLAFDTGLEAAEVVAAKILLELS